MLMNLSAELLHKIATELNPSAHRTLRTVSKDLSLAVNPLFLSTVSLPSGLLRHEAVLDFLRAISTGQTGWSDYCTVLAIQPRWRHDSPTATGLAIPDAEMYALLASVLESVPRTRTVRWYINETAPQWERDAICSALNSFLDLEEFELSAQFGVNAPPSLNLHNLRKLRIQTAWKRLPMSQQFMRLISPQLTCLHISGDFVQEVWGLLNANPHLGIHLKEIHSDLTPDLLVYLASSFSGLERLRLSSTACANERESNQLELPDKFFEVIILRQAPTLLELYCPTEYECRWSFGPHNADAISTLKVLRVLTMSISSADVTNVMAETNSAVSLFLHTVQKLSTLRRLTIFPADKWFNRNECSPMPTMSQHRAALHKGLNAALDELRPRLGVAARVDVADFYYYYQFTLSGPRVLLEPEAKSAQIPVLIIPAAPTVVSQPPVVVQYPSTN
ncbi:hypothetical protein C8R46DRAFT_1118662 [Mycena filopes]|nr:hypothetical protein C8R46DRAFT_1118662 [Mycena filopes]